MITRLLSMYQFNVEAETSELLEVFVTATFPLSTKCESISVVIGRRLLLSYACDGRTKYFFLNAVEW